MDTNKAKGLLAKIKEMFTAAEGGLIVEQYDIAGVITEVAPPPPPNVTTPIPVASTFTDYKLVDGTAISIDKLEVGGLVTIGGTPAPVGEYALEDGSKITVDAGGTITVVTPAMAPVDMSTPEAIQKLEKEIDEIKTTQSGVTTQIGLQKQELDQANKKIIEQSTMLRQMFELMQEVVGLPTGDPPVSGRKKFSFSNVELKTKSLEKYQQAAQKIAEEYKEQLKAV